MSHLVTLRDMLVKLFVRFFVGVCILLTIVLSGCQKSPEAQILTDKMSYTGGEIIHLTSTTEHGGSCLWTMPNGTQYSGNTLDYQLDTNDIGGPHFIKLNAISKCGKQNSAAIKCVYVEQAILPTDFFQAGNVKIVPTKKSSASNGTNWVITAVKQDPTYPLSSHTLSIVLGDNSRPTVSKVYSLTNNKTPMANEAYIELYSRNPEDWYRTTSLSGMLSLSFDSFWRLHISYNDTPSFLELSQGGTYTVTMSGNITIY